MACPFVAGIAALAWAHYPEENAEMIRERILRGATPIETQRRLWRYGLVSAYRSLALPRTVPMRSVPTAVHDLFSKARAIGRVYYSEKIFIPAGATIEENEPTIVLKTNFTYQRVKPCGSVWYRFTPGVTGYYELDLLSDEPIYAYVACVYQGGTLNDLRKVSRSAAESRLSYPYRYDEPLGRCRFYGVAGTSYYIQVATLAYQAPMDLWIELRLGTEAPMISREDRYCLYNVRDNALSRRIYRLGYDKVKLLQSQASPIERRPYGTYNARVWDVVHVTSPGILKILTRSFHDSVAPTLSVYDGNCYESLKLLHENANQQNARQVELNVPVREGQVIKIQRSARVLDPTVVNQPIEVDMLIFPQLNAPPSFLAKDRLPSRPPLTSPTPLLPPCAINSATKHANVAPAAFSSKAV
jgi:hypothetical protein